MLLSLFVASFLAATLLPGGSEALLLYWLDQAPEQLTALVVVASLGNSLGSISSYALGYIGRVKLKPRQLDSKAVAWVRRYGVYTLLMSWLPIVGDILCIAAGYFKLPLAMSLLLITIGKTLRYVLLVIVVGQIYP